ncbi:MAG: hypothetical protein Q9217_004786 [Psora testacea]
MATTVAEHVLRIPRSDSEGEHVLINVSSNGPKPLDIKILATEGQKPYAITKKLEVVASISDSQLGIIFRKNIEGILQRFGELTLHIDEYLEIDTVRWAHIAAQRSDVLEEEVQGLMACYNSQSLMIQKLNQQLDDLITAKHEHEISLLQKFRDLLNAKKLKIRDQQRLLAGAKVDPKQATQVQATRLTTKARTPENSGERKRKAVTSDLEDEGNSFGAKHATKGEEDELSDTDNTLEPSEDEVTEDEGDEGDRGGQVGSKTKPPYRSKANGEMQLDTPPPSRHLPFENPDQDKPAAAVTDPADTQRSLKLNEEAGNEDDETDDDEL